MKMPSKEFRLYAAICLYLLLLAAIALIAFEVFLAIIGILLVLWAGWEIFDWFLDKQIKNYGDDAGPK